MGCSKMAKEKRLIDANVLYKKATDAWDDTLCDVCYSEIINLIDEAPTVDAVEVVHAKWEEIGVADYKCSRCGFRVTSADPISMFQYCRCGAKMDGGDEDGC